MSETIIADAIAESLRADGKYGIITGFITYAEYLDDEGVLRWMVSHPDDQRLSASIGQVEFLRHYLRTCVDSYFADADEGDD